MRPEELGGWEPKNGKELKEPQPLNSQLSYRVGNWGLMDPKPLVNQFLAKIWPPAALSRCSLTEETTSLAP